MPDIGTVVPAAAGTGLLLVIIRLLLTERGQRRALEEADRKRWEAERTSERSDHRAEVERLRKRIDDQAAELDETYRRLRQREGT